MTAAKPKGVRTQHADYARMLPLWEKCRDAAEGEHAVHAAGAKYLPKLAEETDTEYKARLGRTPFFNAVWRTISGLKGMLFRKDPQVKVPSAVAGYLDDVDMAGTPLGLFVQEVCEELLDQGRIGVLVDFPPVESDGALTVAQATSMGLRPMMQQYKAATIINWKQARIGNVMKLTLVVLMEQADVEGVDEFAQETDTQYRVLDLFEGKYRQRLFTVKDEKDVQIGAEIFPLRNNAPLTEIPFVIIGVDHTGPKVETPPLLDLVEMNLHHYTVSADYEHGCHFSGLPTAVISGYNPDDKSGKLYVGGSGIICLPDPQATAAYMEVQGDFEALRKNLDEKKKEMAVLGARMLEEQKSSVEAADTLRQRAAGEQSQLAGMADVVSMAMVRVLTIFSEWAGGTGEVIYQIRKDFIPVGMSAQELTALVQAWQSGAISQQVLFENLQKGEVIAAETTFEEEQERIASNPPLATPEPSEEA